MLESENQKYIDDIIKRGIVDDALCMGTHIHKNFEDVEVGNTFLVTPKYLYPLSKDEFTYEECYKYDKVKHLHSPFYLFKIYEISRIDEYSVYAKEVGTDIEFQLYKSPYFDGWDEYDEAFELYFID